MECMKADCTHPAAGYIHCALYGVSGTKYTSEYPFCADDLLVYEQDYKNYGYDEVTIHYYEG